MGIVLLTDCHPADGLVINLPDRGLIYFKLYYGTDICLISHDLKFHFWSYESAINDINSLPYYDPEPNFHFKIIQLFCSNNNVLIKQPTFTQIKSHVLYFSNITKYILLSQSLCYDVKYLIVDKLFWLEINDIFVSTPRMIISDFGHNNDTVIKRFQNAVKKCPHNWMFL
uniref:Uncharacterized protein n=1 Tax=viral metagenome TaxID=1070528 RepID=A0A6C0C9V1_9ZZZZ